MMGRNTFIHKKMLIVTIFAFNTGKSVVQAAAVQLSMDDLLYVGP